MGDYRNILEWRGVSKWSERELSYVENKREGKRSEYKRGKTKEIGFSIPLEAISVDHVFSAKVQLHLKESVSLLSPKGIWRAKFKLGSSVTSDLLFNSDFFN